MTLLKPQNHKYILVVIRHKYRSSFTDKLYENKLISKMIVCVQVQSFWIQVRNQKRLDILTNYFIRVRQSTKENKNVNIYVHRLNHGYVATLKLPQYFFTLGQINLQCLRNSTSIALSVYFSSLQTIREGKQKIDHDDSFSF